MRLVVVSDEEKKKVLEKCHENSAGTHHGISRTLTLVESNYYWTSVTNDVKQWVWLHSYRSFFNVGCYKRFVILRLQYSKHCFMMKKHKLRIKL